jgi:hypothetical protein
VVVVGARAGVVAPDRDAHRPVVPLGDAERERQPAGHPVRGEHQRRRERGRPVGGAGLHPDHPAGPVEHRAGDRDLLAQPGAGLLGVPDQRLVEVEPRPDQPVVRPGRELRPGQLEPQPAADHPQTLVADPAVLLVGGHAHRDQAVHGARGEPVAAHLLPREARLLQHEHVEPGLGKVVRRRGTGWAGADDDDVSGLFGDHGQSHHGLVNAFTNSMASV